MVWLGGVFVFLWWCFGSVFVVFLWWCFCGGVLVVVFVWWCFCGGVFVVVFLWWCFCGGVFVLVFFVLVFLWWCFCGGVFVVVFLWCGCGGVLGGGCLWAVFLWWCSYGGVLVVVYKVLIQYYSNTTLYYKVLLQYYSVLQSTTPTSETTSERRPSSTTPYYASSTKASKTSISCEASATFQGTSFQNDRFVRSFLQISEKKLPKWSFRAMLLTLFTEKASKMIVSCEASFKFHRTGFQNDRFVRGFFRISQKKLPKWSFRARLPPNFTEQASKMIVSCEASFKFHRTMLPKRAFRAMLPTIFTKNLRSATVSRDGRTDSCERVHPPKAKCASHYNAVHSQMWQCAFRLSGVRKNVWIYRPWTDPLRAHKNVRFYYSFGRSTPRFYWEGSPRANEICVSLQFWAIDTTFLLRGFTASKWNLRFATVLGDRHHVFTERVHREQMKFAFRYSFGRSTPRFYWEGSPRANEICVSLQFWAIDDAFLAKGLISGWPSPSRPAE